MLWQRRAFLLLLLLIAIIIDQGCQANDTKSSPHPSVSPSRGLMSKKVDIDRQGSLLAGPVFLGLSSLLFPVLPLLLVAPLAMAGINPVVNYVSDLVSAQTGTQQTNQVSPNAQAIGEVLASLAQSNGGIKDALHTIAQKAQKNSAAPSAPSSNITPVSSASPVSSLSQVLGLSDSGSDSSSSSSSSSIISGLSNLFGSDKNSGASPSSSLFSGLLGSGSSPGSSSILASGSRPIASFLEPPSSSVNKNKQPAPSADFLGAAAAALDNAGLLGPLSGAGTGSVANQLLNLVSGNKPQSEGSSVSAISDLLGLASSTSNKHVSPASSLASSNPQLGSSLSSNILHSLPQSYNNAINAANGAKPIASAASSLLGSSSASQSGEFITRHDHINIKIPSLLRPNQH